MPKLFLFCFLSCCIAFAACKKDDCECDTLPSTYDPSFTVFPTKNFKWIITRVSNGGVDGRTDTLTVVEPVEISSKSLPYNAIDYSNAEAATSKLYYPIQSRYVNWYNSTNIYDTTFAAPVTATYAYFRIDEDENKLYEGFNNAGTFYEIEVIDWDKKVGDTLYTMPNKNRIWSVDSVLIGKRYLKQINGFWLLQADAGCFRHSPPNFFGTGFIAVVDYKLIYKNDTLKIW